MGKANSSPQGEQVRHYQEKSFDDLKRITPKWAYGENANKVFDFSQHPYCERYGIFLVKTMDLIKNTQFYNFSPDILFIGDLASDSRVATTLHQWENNGFIDPPTITISDQFEGMLSISDGRHRTKLAFLLGEVQIPIAIHNSQIDEVSKIIDLIPT